MGQRNGNAVTFRGWQGGEYGLLDAGVAGRSDKQMFTGKNVILYRNGLLGPRPGLKRLDFTSPPVGVPLGGGALLEAGDEKFYGLLHTGTGPDTYAIYEFAPNTLTVSSAYSETDPIPSPILHNIAPGGGTGGSTYVNLVGYGLYVAIHGTDSFELVSTDPAGDVVQAYGLRLVANNGNVLWFSDPNAFSTIQPTSFLEVSGFSISFFAPFRDGAIIGGVGGIFNMLTGVLGATTVVRELSRGGGPATPFHALRVADDRVWYWNRDYAYPSMFNGSVHQRYDWLNFPGAPSGAVYEGTFPSRNVVACGWAGTDDWVTYGFGDPNTCIYVNGIHTQHDLGYGYPPGAAFELVGKTHVLMCPQNDMLSTGDEQDVFYFAPGLVDRPAFVGDFYARPGDESDTPVDAYFFTPEWWDDDGHEVYINQVVIDYTGWNTGGGDDVGFDVTVHRLHRNGSVGESTSTTVSIADPIGDFTTDMAGTVKRAAPNLDGAFSGGFQIEISNIRNCAFKSVTPVFSETARRV